MKNSPHLSQALTTLLAENTTLYLKSLVFHWNVKGEQFYSLHELFEKHYRELAEANDAIAERLRTIGEDVPLSYDMLRDKSAIQLNAKLPLAQEMVKQLAQDHKHMAETCALVMKQAQEHDDSVTEDLAIQRATFHDKTRWMLESILA